MTPARRSQRTTSAIFASSEDPKETAEETTKITPPSSISPRKRGRKAKTEKIVGSEGLTEEKGEAAATTTATQEPDSPKKKKTKSASKATKEKKKGAEDSVVLTDNNDSTKKKSNVSQSPAKKKAKAADHQRITEKDELPKLWDKEKAKANGSYCEYCTRRG
jgi:hypothetical protein